MWSINTRTLVLNAFFAVLLPNGEMYTPKIAESSAATVHYATCDFDKISRKSWFVDKTEMIKTVIEVASPIYITAPQQFGKSCNLDMLKRFFEIETKAIGKWKPPKRLNHTGEIVDDTYNYHLFVDKNMKITKYKNLMERHFGKHPVISLNLKSVTPISSYGDLTEHLKKVVHEAFTEHAYLQTSTRLKKHEKLACRQWIDESWYKGFNGSDIKTGLNILAEYVHRHYNRKYVLLVDDFSTVSTAVMTYVKKLELDESVNLCWSLFEDIFHGNQIEKGIMTGIFLIYPTWYSTQVQINTYTFWLNREFVDFYGVTNQEFKELAKRRKIDTSRMKTVTAWYNGYTPFDGKQVYNLGSLSSFLNSGEIANYWPHTELSIFLRIAHTCSILRGELEKLIIGENIIIKYKDGIVLEEFVVFEKMSHNRTEIDWDDTRNFFSFLLAYGYVTTLGTTHSTGYDFIDDIYVRIPNEETKSEFNRIWKELLEEIWLLNTTLVDKCANVLNDIAFIDDDKNARNFENFRQTIQEALKSLSDKRIVGQRKDAYRSVLLYVSLRTKYKCSPEYFLARMVADLVFYKGKRCIIFHMVMDKGDKIKTNLGDLVDGQYYGAFNDTRLFPRGVDEYLLVEIRVDAQKKVKLNVLINNDNLENIKAFS